MAASSSRGQGQTIAADEISPPWTSNHYWRPRLAAFMMDVPLDYEPDPRLHDFLGIWKELRGVTCCGRMVLHNVTSIEPKYMYYQDDIAGTRSPVDNHMIYKSWWVGPEINGEDVTLFAEGEYTVPPVRGWRAYAKGYIDDTAQMITLVPKENPQGRLPPPCFGPNCHNLEFPNREKPGCINELCQACCDSVVLLTGYACPFHPQEGRCDRQEKNLSLIHI